MKNKYRIITDAFCGYEAQIKYWWFPFKWFQVYGANTSESIEKAEKLINNYRSGLTYFGKPKKGKVVKYID